MSNSLQIMDGSHQAPLSWNSPGKNSGMGCHALLQGILLTQGSNPGLLHVGELLKVCTIFHSHQQYEGANFPTLQQSMLSIR